MSCYNNKVSMMQEHDGSRIVLGGRKLAEVSQQLERARRGADDWYRRYLQNPEDQELYYKHWREHDKSARLENALKSGAIALLDSWWLLECAAKFEHKATIKRRQDLPSEAFLTFDHILAYSRGGMYEKELNIVMLSYMWLHPDHPDPYGETFRTIAEWFLQLKEGDGILESGWQLRCVSLGTPLATTV